MKAVHVFLDVNMGLGHMGLYREAKKGGVDLRFLSKDEAVLFINTARNKFKSYAHNGVVSYVRLDDPRDALSLAAFDMIPQSVSAKARFEYAPRAQKAVEKLLGIATKQRPASHIGASAAA
jgi:hypothetical protein